MDDDDDDETPLVSSLTPDELTLTVSRCCVHFHPRMRKSQQSAGNGWTVMCRPICLRFHFCAICESLHISLFCRPYRTLPSHLINHTIEVNATQQKSNLRTLPLLFLLGAIPLPGGSVFHGWDIPLRPLFNQVCRGFFFITTGLPLCR